MGEISTMTLCQCGFQSAAGGWVSLPTSVTVLLVSPWISCSFPISLTDDPEIRVGRDRKSSLFLCLKQQLPTGRPWFLVVEGRT